MLFHIFLCVCVIRVGATITTATTTRTLPTVRAEERVAPLVPRSLSNPTAPRFSLSLCASHYPVLIPTLLTARQTGVSSFRRRAQPSFRLVICRSSVIRQTDGLSFQFVSFTPRYCEIYDVILFICDWNLDSVRWFCRDFCWATECAIGKLAVTWKAQRKKRIFLRLAINIWTTSRNLMIALKRG